MIDWKIVTYVTEQRFKIMPLVVYLLCLSLAVALSAVNCLIPALILVGIAGFIALRREVSFLGSLGLLVAEHVVAQHRYRVTMVTSPRTRSSR